MCLLKCGRAGYAISAGKVDRNYFVCPRYHTSINILLDADKQQIFAVISPWTCVKLSDVPEVLALMAGLQSPKVVLKK